jgi:hypothetical protein
MSGSSIFGSLYRLQLHKPQVYSIDEARTAGRTIRMPPLPDRRYHR